MHIIAKSALLLGCVFPLALQAQARSATAIAGGASIPMGSQRDTQKAGTDLNLSLVRGSDESPFGVRLNLDFARLPGKSVQGAKMPDRRMVGGMLDAMMNTSGHIIKPYVLAGVGAFKMTSKPAGTEEKTRFGFDFGAGVMFPLANKAFFVETRLNSISQHNAKPVRYLPIVLGVLF